MATASSDYKTRLAGLLTEEFLAPHLPQPEGNRSRVNSARNLSLICGELVSFMVISNWKTASFAYELDSTGLEALAKIARHLEKTPQEIEVYLRTGDWLPQHVSARIRSLVQQREAIDQNILELVAA